MKPLIFAPPAQAEALFDTQEDLRGNLPLNDRTPSVPWRDEEGLEEPLSHLLPQPLRLNRNAQL